MAALKITGGRFPKDMSGAIPLPLVAWVSNSPNLVKAVNAPFSLTINDDDTGWEMTYEVDGGAWKTTGGTLVKEGDNMRLDSEDFWLLAKRVEKK